jgi:hypothetical protein
MVATRSTGDPSVTAGSTSATAAGSVAASAGSLAASAENAPIAAGDPHATIPSDRDSARIVPAASSSAGTA